MRTPVSVLLAAVVALLGACAQPELPSDVWYRLQVPAPAAPAAAPSLGGGLEVARPRAEGVVAERPLVYAEADMPNRFYQYTYHHWAEPPARMLQDELVDYLRAAGAADRVTLPEQRADAEWLLSTRLRGLEQVRGADGHVHVLLEFTLRRAADGALVWTRQMERRRETVDSSLPAAVGAFEAALASIFDELAGAL